MTREQYEGHQRRHGFMPVADGAGVGETVPLGNRVRGRGMNKTEREYAMILEGMKQEGKIWRYLYEGVTLRWGGIKYTADFAVFAVEIEAGLRVSVGPKLIEVKGGFIGGKFERAVERFRHARSYWVEFEFEMWQKQEGGWKRIE